MGGRRGPRADLLAGVGAGTERVHAFEVVSNEPVAEGIWRMLIASAELAAEIRPGQFMNVAVPGDARRILRVPLSFAHADADSGTIELVYAVVGEGTERLSCMAPGDASDAIGPCGRGWSLPAREGRCLLVAGGVGLPPIVAAAGMLSEAHVGFDAVVGAQTVARMDLADARSLEAIGRPDGTAGSGDDPDPDRLVRLATDDGTLGVHGFVTDAMGSLLAERRYAQVMCCGPQPMMAGVAALAAEADVACAASLERMMGCGFGACGCCNVELVGGGYARCCTDGPVFDAREVVW
jgi:dihydroorotate dehydrogenase electron transfer subunit